MSHNPAWTIIEDELEFRANPSGATCVIRADQTSGLIPQEGIRLDESIYSLIERTVPVAYGSELLCRHPATLLCDRRVVVEQGQMESLTSSQVVALEVLDEQERFSMSYLLSPRDELRSLAAIRQELIAGSPPDRDTQPWECSVGGVLIAGKDRCLLAPKYPYEPGQPAALLDHTVWFPVLKRQIPADRQPAWPFLVVPAVVRGLLTTDSSPPPWRFTDVTSITVQLLRCLHRISSNGDRPRWIYQDLNW